MDARTFEQYFKQYLIGDQLRSRRQCASSTSVGVLRTGSDVSWLFCMGEDSDIFSLQQIRQTIQVVMHAAWKG